MFSAYHTAPLKKILLKILPLVARGYRPLQMTFEERLNALILFHLERRTSGRHLLQVLEEDEFARKAVANPKVSKRAVSLRQ